MGTTLAINHQRDRELKQRALQLSERPEVGFDPVVWIDRLRDVNKGSAFTADQKKRIEETLYQLRWELKNGDTVDLG